MYPSYKLDNSFSLSCFEKENDILLALNYYTVTVATAY